MTRPPYRPRGAYRAWRTIPTRWMDNDAYGHVNNVIYYSWFDTAVNAWLVDAGLLDVNEGRLIGLVVETGCRYAASVSFPQTIEAGIRVAHLGTSSVCYEVGLYLAGTNAAAAEGYFTHVYVDRDTRRPTPLPDNWRGELGRIAV